MKLWKHRTERRTLLNALLLTIVSSLDIALESQRKKTTSNMPVTPTQPTQASAASSYITRVFTDDHNKQMTYYLSIPVDYDRQKRYPLVLLLHGGGESAKVQNTPAQNRDALLNQAYVRVWNSDYSSPYSPEVQTHWPSFIVVPQVISPHRWVDIPAQKGSYALAAQPSDALRMAKEIVDDLQKQYNNIDPHRLYITGLSMGGYGTWEAIERWPNYFAAAAPIAGAGDPSKAHLLTNLPIWAFQGEKDDVVPISGSRDMIKAIRAAGGNPLYTEFPGEKHIVWPYVYSFSGTANHVLGFFSWLFSQKNSTSK